MIVQYEYLQVFIDRSIAKATQHGSVDRSNIFKKHYIVVTETQYIKHKRRSPELLVPFDDGDVCIQRHAQRKHKLALTLSK